MSSEAYVCAFWWCLYALIMGKAAQQGDLTGVIFCSVICGMMTVLFCAKRRGWRTE